MQSIDSVAGGWIGNSMGGAHGVARVPEAVDPQKGIAAGEVLVGWCPSIGGGDGVGSGMGALATCQLGDERHRVGARAVIGMRGIVVRGTPSITEEPIGRLARWVARQRYAVVVDNGASVEEIHRESIAAVVLGTEGVDDGVGPEVGDKGVHGEELLGYIEARKLIYLPCYKWVLENKLQKLVAAVRIISKNKPVVLLDYNTNPDVNNPKKPLSHASLIKAYIEGNYPK